MNEKKQDQEAQEAKLAAKPRRGAVRGLGRGLSALFEDDEDSFTESQSSGGKSGSGRTMVGLDQLEPGPFQPRQYMAHEGLDELAESISAHGVLQPLLVRKRPGYDDRYEIIAGERRWRAAQRAQLHEVPVHLLDISDEKAAEIALIENLQREDLNAIEEAQGFQRLMKEFGHTQEKLAATLGKSRSHLANTMRLLRLPQPVQMLVRQEKLSAGHARALITADNPEELARQVINQGLSVRETERLAAAKAERSGAGSPAKKTKPAKDVNVIALEDELSQVLGMKVGIMCQSYDKGTVRIDFSSLDQLDDLIARLKG